MPTPPLPLLHQLLRVLHIPVFPPTLTSISPSLLLIILETLIGQPLPLSREMRLCSTPDAELSVIKCLLGVLADDLLGMEALTLVDPRAVLEGRERELEVVIMAFAVVARRLGLNLRLPQPQTAKMDRWEEEDARTAEELQEPIEPDVSFSSPIRAGHDDDDDDVFLAAKPRHKSAKIDIERWSKSTSSAATSDHSQLAAADPKRTRTRTVLDEILEEFGT